MLPVPPNIDHLGVSQTNDSYEFVLSDGASWDSFLALLLWLPEGFELFFYDQYYPSMSDPGAYVSIQRREGIFIYMLGNHGWSGEWLKQSPELLAAWLALNMRKKGEFYEPLSSITVRKANSNPWLR